MPLFKAIVSVAHLYFSCEDAAKRQVYEAQLRFLLDQVIPEILPVSVSPLTNLEPMESDSEYYHIYESPLFTLGLFCLRKGTEMPIHDHPQMTVFSKIVKGDLHVCTFDVIKKQVNSNGLLTLDCKLSLNETISAGKNNVLTISPTVDTNLHSFKAVSEHTMLLDIVGPPYDPAQDRNCTYFVKKSETGDTVVLEQSAETNFDCIHRSFLTKYTPES